MNYNIMNRIAERCQADKDYPARITAYYLILGTGDHSHAMYFKCEREREDFEAKHAKDLELWELFYSKALYIPPTSRVEDPWWIKERELKKALWDAPRGSAEEFRAKIAYNDHYNSRYGRRNRDR